LKLEILNTHVCQQVPALCVAHKVFPPANRQSEELAVCLAVVAAEENKKMRGSEVSDGNTCLDAPGRQKWGNKLSGVVETYLPAVRQSGESAFPCFWCTAALAEQHGTEVSRSHGSEVLDGGTCLDAANRRSWEDELSGGPLRGRGATGSVGWSHLLALVLFKLLLPSCEATPLFTSTALEFRPAQVNVPMELIIAFTTNETVAQGDQVSVVLPGFGAARPDFNPTIESFSVFRQANWVRCPLRPP